MAGVKGMKWRATQSPTALKQLRDRIKAAKIIDQLQEHVGGIREMTATQVTAGLGLLRKVLPDVTHVEHSGEVENTVMVANAQALIAKLRDEYPDASEVATTPVTH